KFRGDAELERQRFLQEARAALALVHPNIVRVLDQGESRSGLYLVLELVPGESLRAELERAGPLPLARAVSIGRQLASALEAARLAGVVHRDVKPENILVRPDGVAKLADFGFARCTFEVPDSRITRQGEILGTVAYMAPEQFGGADRADHRSDVYAF